MYRIPKPNIYLFSQRKSFLAILQIIPNVDQSSIYLPSFFFQNQSRCTAVVYFTERKFPRVGLQRPYPYEFSGQKWDAEFFDDKENPACGRRLRKTIRGGSKSYARYRRRRMKQIRNTNLPWLRQFVRFMVSPVVDSRCVLYDAFVALEISHAAAAEDEWRRRPWVALITSCARWKKNLTKQKLHIFSIT